MEVFVLTFAQHMRLAASLFSSTSPADVKKKRDQAVTVRVAGHLGSDPFAWVSCHVMCRPRISKAERAEVLAPSAGRCTETPMWMSNSSSEVCRKARRGSRLISMHERE